MPARNAGSTRNVVVIGNTGRFEIWDAKRYDEVIDDTDISMLLDLAE